MAFFLQTLPPSCLIELTAEEANLTTRERSRERKRKSNHTEKNVEKHCLGVVKDKAGRGSDQVKERAGEQGLCAAAEVVNVPNPKT